MKPLLYQHHQTCFVAANCQESRAWSNCFPSATIGYRLDNESFRLAVSIRLGLRVCTPHHCRCGSRVDEYELHPLSCRFSIGRLPRNTARSDVIHISLQSAGIPAQLEPAGLDRGDGNRPDDVALFPYTRGNSLVWAATLHVSAFVLSRIDYCNSLLLGSTHDVTPHLQRIKNYAARLILRLQKSSSITIHLKSLHWLPVKVRSTYNIACLCYHCHSSTAPSYVTDMLHRKPLHTRNTRSSSYTMTLLMMVFLRNALMCA